MRLKSIITENDFIAYAPAALTKVDEHPTIADNSYSWTTLKAVHVNDASAAVVGYFRLPLGFLKSGDVVTISAEFWNVGGDKPRISLDYSTSAVVGTGTTLSYVLSLNSITTGFETIEITRQIVTDAYYSVVFGTVTSEIGEFYMRNCVAKCESNYNTDTKNYKRASRHYFLNVTGGNATVNNNYCLDTATCTIDSPNKKILLVHDLPFGQGPALTFTQMDQSTPAYYAQSRTVAYNGCSLFIYDIATQTLQDPAAITATFYAFFAGYDNEVDLI